MVATSSSHAQPVDPLGRADQERQVEAQVNRLVEAIKDEYANEAPNGRAVQFVDVPGFGMIAVGTFAIEGFGGGNNVHQYVALFGPPNDQGTAST